MPTPPLVSSQDRWKEFFAQQGRQMPASPRPLPTQSQAPQAPPMGGGLPQLPPQVGGSLAYWQRKRAEMRAQGLLPRQQQMQQMQPPQMQPPQGTQEFAREPMQQQRMGFFGRRGGY
jgi:hypothetical protein